MIASFDNAQAPSNVDETIAWLLRLGRPPLPECPIEAAKQGKEPKAPCYFDGKRVVSISWKEWQNQQPIQEIYDTWFANQKTGIGTLGGWNGKHWLGWIDFDQKDFSSSDECDRAIDEWTERYAVMANAPMFRTPNGGYRFLVAFSQEPNNFKSNSGFSLSPDGSHHVGELLAKNGGHTLLPPTIGVNGKPYRWERWKEYPPVVEQPENVGLYPVQKRTENKTVVAKQGATSDHTDTGPGEFLKSEIYPLLSVDVAFCWSGHDFKASGEKLRGNCPWHDSRSGTAFYVNKEDGTYFWGCPSCNINGNVVAYRHRLAGGNGSPRGREFVDIVRELANDVGVSMPIWQNGSASKAVPHSFVDQAVGKGNPSRSRENPYELVKALICSGISETQLAGELINLSTSTGYQLGGLQTLARKIETEVSSQSTQLDDAKETTKLLEYREQTLDLRSVFPAPLAYCLLTKATSDRVDPVFVYQYLWSAIGLSLGAHIGIEGKKGTTLADSWVEYPIYYNITVAPPSFGKSQTMRGTLGPIKRKQEKERGEYKKAQKHLEKLKEEWNKKSPDDRERLKNSESNPSVYQEQMPQPPQVKLIEAGTPEGAFKRMGEFPAMSGCALAFDELIRILSLDQYKNQGGDTRQVLMEAWSHPYSTEFLRSDDKNTLSLNKICINVTGGIQPAKIKKLLSDPDDGDGLLSRFLIGQAKTPDDFANWSSTQVDIDLTLSKLYQFLGELHYDLRKTIYGEDYIQSIADGKQIILKLNAAAEKRWQQWWEHVRGQMQKVEHENPALFGYLGKMLSQTLRIALGLHCIELMYEEKVSHLTVGIETLERAIYAAKFHIGQFRLLQTNNDTNNLQGLLQAIHSYALRKGQPVSATQIQNTVFRRHSPKPSLAEIRECFHLLVQANAARLVGEGKDLKILAFVVTPTNSEQKSDTSKKVEIQLHVGEEDLNLSNSDNSDNFSTSWKNEGKSPYAKNELQKSSPESITTQDLKVGGQEQKTSETGTRQIPLSTSSDDLCPLSCPQTSNSLNASNSANRKRIQSSEVDCLSSSNYQLPPEEERF